jgi:hypothetical protein
MNKEQFLDKYNKSRTINEALSRSIRAAVQHNKLYNIDSTSSRELIREFWSDSLIEISKRFVLENWNEDYYEKEIIGLKKVMNDKYGQNIDFRISHSQKSIGVFFKHLWCLGDIPTPPQCPIDRIILTKAKAPIYHRSWGAVNDIETHRLKYAFIKQKALSDGYNNVSLWELEHFN